MPQRSFSFCPDVAVVSGSQPLPSRQDSIISCHASPVALLRPRHRAQHPAAGRMGQGGQTPLCEPPTCSSLPEEEHEGAKEAAEVVVPVNVAFLIQLDVAKNLPEGEKGSGNTAGAGEVAARSPWLGAHDVVWDQSCPRAQVEKQPREGMRAQILPSKDERW